MRLTSSSVPFGLLALTLLFAAAAGAAEPAAKHVIVISIDGLPAYLFDDANVPLTTIRELAAGGVVAEGMTVSNPSVTWPNHTSLVTGMRPEEHGVLFNGVLERPGLGLPVKVDPRRDKADLVHAPTIYDILHARGLTCSGVNWPCTRNAATLDNVLPDVPETFEHTAPQFRESLAAAGILSDEFIRNFPKLSPIARDRLWTQAACHVVRTRQPNLLLLHLLNVDAVHHKYGPQTWAGYSAVAYADACLRELLQAVDAAGIRDQTAVFVIADHGFISIPKTLRPNALLRQAGLLTVEGNQIASARVHVIPEGGIGMVYLTVPDTKAADRRKVIELFEKQEGISGVLTPEEFAAYGLPLPDEYPQMADLILVAMDGYGFDATASGEDFVADSTATLGTHGFLSTNPRMNAIFVASGAGIRPGGKLGVIENIDLAPTVARLLGVDFPNVTGRVLQDILVASPVTSK